MSDDDRIDDRTEWDGDNVERREGDWESVMVMIIAALKCTLLTFVFIGKDKKQWGSVRQKVLHTCDADGKIF
jgi:hypothetical protein